MFPIFCPGLYFHLFCRSYWNSKWSGLNWPQCLLITENPFRSRTKVKTKKSQFRGLLLPPQVGRYPLRVLTMLIYRFSGCFGVLGSKMPNDLLEIIRGQMRSNASKRLILDGRSFSLSFIHIGPSPPILSKILGLIHSTVLSLLAPAKRRYTKII